MEGLYQWLKPAPSQWSTEKQPLTPDVCRLRSKSERSDMFASNKDSASLRRKLLQRRLRLASWAVDGRLPSRRILTWTELSSKFTKTLPSVASGSVCDLFRLWNQYCEADFDLCGDTVHTLSHVCRVVGPPAALLSGSPAAGFLSVTVTSAAFLNIPWNLSMFDWLNGPTLQTRPRWWKEDFGTQ